MISANTLRELLDYNPDTGELTWRVSPRANVEAGSIAGSVRDDGYRSVVIGRKAYKAHRLIWMYVYGEFPNGEIDHINRDRDDNRIDNLREVSRSMNQYNAGIRSDNKSGFKGVSYSKSKCRWIAKLGSKQLGAFKDKLEAIKCRLEAENNHVIYSS